MSNLRTFQISEGINLHCLKDDKFTTNSVTFFIRTNLTNETAAKAALLARVLKSGCSEYPSVSLFNRHLQELYGCTMDIFTFKKDCRLVLCLNFVFANKAVLLPKVFFVAGNTLLSPKTFLNRFMEADFSNGVYAPVSYTHLDVYKRQTLTVLARPSISSVASLSSTPSSLEITCPPVRIAISSSIAFLLSP